MTGKFVLMNNDSLYTMPDNRNVSDLEGWKRELVRWNKGSDVFEVEGEELDVDQLISALQAGSVDVENEVMVDRGDDYTTIELFQLIE